MYFGSCESVSQPTQISSETRFWGSIKVIALSSSLSSNGRNAYDCARFPSFHFIGNNIQQRNMPCEVCGNYLLRLREIFDGSFMFSQIAKNRNHYFGFLCQWVVENFMFVKFCAIEINGFCFYSVPNSNIRSKPLLVIIYISWC